MSADRAPLFDARYFEQESVYARFADAAEAASALAHWYEGLFRLLRRRYSAAYPLCPPALEVGTGHGAVLGLLERSGVETVGCDLSTFVLHGQRCLAPSRRLVAADAGRLPFADASFRTLLMFEVLEHLPDPRLALREIARVLHTGGVLLATTPNPAADRLPGFDSGADATHVSVHARRWWAAALSEAGFAATRVTTYLQVPFLWRRRAFARRALELPRIGPSCLLVARRP